MTFGTAPGPISTLPASRKAIERRTANDYVGTSPSGRVLSCPMPQCPTSVDETWAVEGFHKYMEDGMEITSVPLNVI